MNRHSSRYRGRMLRSLFAVHLKPELKELYQFSLLFSFASALITIFEPIFFYQQAMSLSMIAAYYAVHYTLYVFLLPLGARFAAIFGFERSMAFSLPIFVLYFLALAGVPDYEWLLWVAMLLLTLHKMFYWPAYHASLARMGDKQNSGTELSLLTLIRFGVGILGPLIGGVIATWFGFQVLFVITAITILLSSLPMLKTRERYVPSAFSYASVWRVITSRRNRGMVLGMLGMGENLIDLVFWPIFMFIILGTADQVGFVAAFTVGLMALLGFGIGELTDRFPRIFILRLHLPFMVVGYLFRPIALSSVGVLLTDTLNKMAFIGVNIPMSYYLYERSKAVGYLRYATAFELVLALAKAITAWFLVWLFYVSLPYTAFAWTFILSAALALFYFFF